MKLTKSDTTPMSRAMLLASDVIQRPRLPVWVLILTLVGSGSIYLIILSPEKFGVQYDDSVYVTTAKALATGQGYRVVSLPYEPAQTKYPPAYPLLLALIWRFYPEFPENLTVMMIASVLATLIFLTLTWKYLVDQKYAGRWLSVAVVALTALNVRTTILATSIVSEMLYAAIAVVGLQLTERYEKEPRNWVLGAGAGVAIGLAFLTRSAGLALLIAVALYFAVRRRWRNGLLPVAVGGMFVIGWVGWSYINRSTVEGVNVAYYTSYFRDFNEVLGVLQTVTNESKLAILLSIVVRNVLGLITVSVPICLGLPYELIPYFGFAFLFIASGFIRISSEGLRLVQAYVISYLAFHLVWPYITYSRFLMPLLPFLLLFVITEFERLFALVKKEWSTRGQVIKKLGASLIGAATMLTTCAVLYYSGRDIYRSLESSTLRKAARPAVEDEQAIEWIKENTNQSDVLISSRDPLYFLHTGRKATRSFPVNLTEAALPLLSHEQATSELKRYIFKIVDESKARYIVLTANDFGYDSDPERTGLRTILEEHPGTFIPVFNATDGRSTIYRIDK
jgi:hypothetical protein